MEAKDLFAKHCKKKKLPKEWLGNPNVEINLMNVHEFIQAIAEIISSPVEPEVSQATCGFCKDCKFWNAENAECTNDVIFINKDVATGYISDFKTQNFFGCIKFESKLSG